MIAFAVAFFSFAAWIAVSGFIAAMRDPEASHDSTVAGQQEAQFNLAMAGARELKNMVRDPDSLEIASALAMPDGQTVCYEYRARNGFGGMNDGQAVLTGGMLYAESAGKFRKLWKGHCAGHVGSEEGHDVNGVLREEEKQEQ